MMNVIEMKAYLKKDIKENQEKKKVMIFTTDADLFFTQMRDLINSMEKKNG